VTQLEALEKLLVEIEAGSLPQAVFHGSSCVRGHWAYLTPFSSEQRTKIYLAYNGSLDAAKLLHDAVLWAVDPQYGYLVGPQYARIVHPSCGIVCDTQSNTPARAWLIAIIKALIAQEEEEE